VMPDLADTLSAVAADGPDAVYQGRVAAAICESSWLDETDLAAYEPDWVEPLSLRYRDVEVVELPPPTQGVAALEALGIYEHMQPGLISEVAAVQRSLEDAFRFVRDGADVGHLLAARHLRQRSSEATRGVNVPDGGTVYLCVVDQDRMAVSFIQSIFGHFGSGLVAPGTGIVLNNRAACFAVAGVVDPGRRPYHTIIPGMLLKNGELLGPFGVMGGLIQAQAHVQLVRAIVDDHCDPQAALDRPRFRIDGSDIHLEPGYWQHAEELRQLGLTPVCSEQTTPFGGGQAILARGDSLLGGSDARRDGHAAGM
jgi:gamma-glutamyltranspeptidase/glutathione hydrolase